MRGTSPRTTVRINRVLKLSEKGLGFHSKYNKSRKSQNLSFGLKIAFNEIQLKH